ncbi:PHP-associated domain-containing protein [Natrialbaceae archaeon AArc-T1-2]|uniref:PHP-associated domain-containing protein n=1 Tax=Natrialbaceae archaeon AArc-T1-2 TaxID=3053904 RepID=UPI00255B094F|nr:PHP-associated domain-containing protein [Natrialbaceae archaeon AArc-T1-2]WIV66880.1 PHP-associated domain-containing protein [Natrialbaceae archaeon AArc-T1-2]
MFAVDLHAHTRFFHGCHSLGDRFDPLGFRLLAWAVSRRGLDGVATTNHDYYTPFSSSSVVTIPGIEVSTTHGHVLVVGPDPPTETVPLEYTPTETVELAHERDCAAIVAHPFRNSTVADLEDVPFDAIEVNGKHPRTRPLVERVADAHDVPLVGGSDAHAPFEAGRAYTVIDADRLTPTSVADAIQDGRVEPRVAKSHLDGVLRRAYRELHRRKHPDDVLARPTPGVGSPPGERD